MVESNIVFLSASFDDNLKNHGTLRTFCRFIMSYGKSTVVKRFWSLLNIFYWFIIYIVLVL